MLKPNVEKENSARTLTLI